MRNAKKSVKSVNSDKKSETLILYVLTAICSSNFNKPYFYARFIGYNFEKTRFPPLLASIVDSGSDNDLPGFFYNVQ